MTCLFIALKIPVKGKNRKTKKKLLSLKFIYFFTLCVAVLLRVIYVTLLSAELAHVVLLVCFANADWSGLVLNI